MHDTRDDGRELGTGGRRGGERDGVEEEENIGREKEEGGGGRGKERGSRRREEEERERGRPGQVPRIYSNFTIINSAPGTHPALVRLSPSLCIVNRLRYLYLSVLYFIFYSDVTQLLPWAISPPYYRVLT
jgi:hypothetical protein